MTTVIRTTQPVTRDMVCRALAAYWALDKLPPPGVTTQLGERMRVALAAALEVRDG